MILINIILSNSQNKFVIPLYSLEGRGLSIFLEFIFLSEEGKNASGITFGALLPRWMTVLSCIFSYIVYNLVGAFLGLEFSSAIKKKKNQLPYFFLNS